MAGLGVSIHQLLGTGATESPPAPGDELANYTGTKTNKVVKAHKCFQSHGHVKRKKKKKKEAYCCSKFNADYLLSGRDNSTLDVFPQPTHCDLASRSRSSKRA